MQATSAIRLKIGARAMFRAPLDCSPNHLRQAFYLKSSGAAQRPFSGNRILTSQPPATNFFQPLCGISKGVQNVVSEAKLQLCLTPTISTLLQAAGRAAAAAPARLRPPLHLHQDAVAQGEVPRLQVVVHQAGLLPASRGKSAFE